jgi:hypothetical protein
MKIIEVKDKATAKEFLKINVLMNQSNPCYIRPLDTEVNDVFDPEKNKLFKHGEVVRWILKSDDEKLLGRIAAFTNKNYINKGTEFLTGGVGYFDCINDQAAANILFDTAKKWLIEKGMDAMDGPINFGDRDKNWGLLVEGFNREPMYGMAFNPSYYQALFEDYGFKNYYNQYYYGMNVDDPFQPKIAERHARFASKKEYSAKHIDMKNIEKYAGDFATVYNAAWAQHGEAKETTKEQMLKMFKTMKPIMDKRLVWFAYYKDEPIAMFINIPDVNQYFKHFNGKMGLLQKIHLMWMKYTGQNKQATGLAFGVVPKFQALGIDSYIIHEVAMCIQNKGWYYTYEMGWAGEWNPRMINIYKSLGGIQSRHMITYRCIFDENKNPFKRHPEMEYK